MSHRPTLGSRALLESGPALWLVRATDIVAVRDGSASARPEQTATLGGATPSPSGPLAPDDHDYPAWT